MLEERYINPFTDFGFKKLFGEEPNKDLLIDFLNQLLPEKHKIEDLEYQKNEQLGNLIVDRRAIFDLYCKSKSGERFLVEIQKAKQDYFKDRSIFYSSFPIQEQAKKGLWDFELSAVYTIGILDFVFSDHKNEKDKLFHRVQLKDQNCNVFYDKLTYLYLELPKFKKQADELENKFEKWLYVFRYLPDLQNRPAALQERIFKKLFDVAEIASFDRKDLDAYEESLKVFRDLKNVTDSAKREGLKRGIEEGIQKGIQKGIQEGIKEGIKEATQKGVKAALRQGALSTKQIAEIFNLTEKDIINIKNSEN